MILALDISTSITGATVLSDGGQILCCEAWDTRNKNVYENIFSKAKEIERNLREINSRFDIKHIYIEKSLQSFRSGFSSAQTLSTLSAFNGIVSWLCYQIYHHVPQYIAAPTARKLCGIKIIKGTKAKEVVLKHLLDKEGSFTIDYTQYGNPTPGSYDRADSIVIAKAGYILCRQSRKNETS